VNVVIVGCGNVGFELARRLAGRHRLVLVDRRRSEHVSDFLRAHPDASFHEWDVMNHAAAPEIDGAVDVVVCTVGTLGTATPADDFGRFRTELELNYLGPVACVKRFLPRMIERRSGRLVIVTSTSGHHAARELTAYAPSKWALEAFTAALRPELEGTGVELDVVSPFNIKNRWSEVFAFDFGIAPELVAARIERCFAEPGHGRIFVPRRYEALHVIERLSPGLLDRQAGLMWSSRRRASHRRRSATRLAIYRASPEGALGHAVARAYEAHGPVATLRSTDDLDRETDALVSVAEVDDRFTGDVLATPIERYREALEALLYVPVRLASALPNASRIVHVLSPPPIAPRARSSATAAPLAALWAWTRTLRRLRGASTQVLEALVAPPADPNAAARAIVAADRAGREMVMLPRPSLLVALTAEALHLR